MCIFDPIPVKVDKPITVFKLVLHLKDENRDRWITPYIKKKISEDVIQGKSNMVADDPHSGHGSCIENGYVHAYIDFLDAFKDYDLLSLIHNDIDRTVEMYECEIPVDTDNRYSDYCYKESASDNIIRRTIAAREIRFRKFLSNRCIKNKLRKHNINV